MAAEVEAALYMDETPLPYFGDEMVLAERDDEEPATTNVTSTVAPSARTYVRTHVASQPRLRQIATRRPCLLRT